MKSYSDLKILIIGARERHALVIARSLGRLGCQIYTADCFRFATATLSRYSCGSFLYSDPEKNVSQFLDDLEKILKNQNFDYVFAVSDLLPILLSQNMGRFKGLSIFAITDPGLFELANIKSKTFEIAEMCDVAAPKTRVLSSDDSIEEVLKGLDFPLVLKPVSKTHLQGSQKSESLKAFYIHHKTELAKLMQDFGGSGRKFLLQEYVPGLCGEGVGALCAKGKALALFSYKRLHEYPLSGGASTLRISTNDEDLKSRAARLLEAMKWDGVAMVEFKRDLRSGVPKLIEVNGRYWGSLALAVESGVDFPALHLRYLRGETFEMPVYTTGVKVRWFLPGDLLYTWALLSQKGVSVLKELWQNCFVKDDVWSWRDPLPILGEIRSSFFYLVQVLKKQRSMSGEYRG